MSALKKFGVGCGGCALVAVVLIVALAGVLYYGFRQTDATISPKLESLFATIADGTFADNYEAETTEAFRRVTTKEQYSALGRIIDLRLGSLKSRSLQSYKLTQQNSTTRLAVIYGAVFEKATGQIKATFEKQDGVWKILAFHVDSPAFQQDQLSGECPKCGTPHAANAAFCPSCGAELPQDEPPSDGEDSPSEDGKIAVRTNSVRPARFCRVSEYAIR